MVDQDDGRFRFRKRGCRPGLQEEMAQLGDSRRLHIFMMRLRKHRLGAADLKLVLAVVTLQGASQLADDADDLAPLEVTWKRVGENLSQDPHVAIVHC